MKLVIISDMPHHRAGETIVGHGATVRELDVLASLFDEVRHLAYLYDGSAPASELAYRAPNLTLVPFTPSGGAGIAAKLGVVARFPEYVRTILRELEGADAVHVRCPANSALCAFAILAARQTPRRRWIKYAGAWQPTGPEPASYRLQRRWLETPHLRARVTIAGANSAQPPHVLTIKNPCLTDDELAAGSAAAVAKLFAPPFRLLFVGHLGVAKNPGAVIEAVAELRSRNVSATLDLVGEGDASSLRRTIEHAGLSASVRFHGALPRHEINHLYEAAHFVVLPSRTEGWPKVLAEGMAAGAIPIASAVGSVALILNELGVGRALPVPVRATDLAAAIMEYVHDPTRWLAERTAAVAGARAFGYTAYLETVRRIFDLA
jgi:glycosyltransferase involved in cell wall biosynthesis